MRVERQSIFWSLRQAFTTRPQEHLMLLRPCRRNPTNQFDELGVSELMRVMSFCAFILPWVLGHHRPEVSDDIVLATLGVACREKHSASGSVVSLQCMRIQNFSLLRFPGLGRVGNCTRGWWGWAWWAQASSRCSCCAIARIAVQGQTGWNIPTQAYVVAHNPAAQSTRKLRNSYKHIHEAGAQCCHGLPVRSGVSKL